MPPSEIRRDARETLKGKWGKAVSITLVFLAVSIIIGSVQNFINTFIKNDIVALLFLVIEVPLSFGLLISFIKLKRNEDFSSFDFLKEGFSRFGKAWGIGFHTFIRILLPILCLFLILLLLLSLGWINSLNKANLFLILLGIGLFVTTLVYVMSIILLYVLAYYISFDNPKMSSKECVKKSAELMKGNRGNYFMLELSFLGWAILAVISFGIGILWLMPYMQVATVCFYERVINKNEPEKIEE